MSLSILSPIQVSKAGISLESSVQKAILMYSKVTRALSESQSKEIPRHHVPSPSYGNYIQLKTSQVLLPTQGEWEIST